MGMALWYTLCDHHADVLPFIQPLVGPCLFTGRGALRTSVPACHCQDECLQYGLGHYDAVDRWSLGKYDLVVRFLRGARRLNPPRSPLVPSWDLSVVLAGLQRDPFEPLESVELKYLSIKTVLLIALTFIKRVRDLQAFSVSEEFLVFGPAYSHVVPRDPGLDTFPRFPPLPSETRWWTCKSAEREGCLQAEVGPLDSECFSSLRDDWGSQVNP